MTTKQVSGKNGTVSFQVRAAELEELERSSREMVRKELDTLEELRHGIKHEELEARETLARTEHLEASTANSLERGKVLQQVAGLLEVVKMVGTAYAPVSEAHAAALIAEHNTASCCEAAKQAVVQMILDAKTPEELAAAKAKLEAIRAVAKV